ncbi:hypothetical protein [Adlercreutzia sp. ZJ141]|uniref:hypothetical protein n=1 Tax=Adlercreutzia sp. ZJ141 TaxID=2709406 RepID=UPI0013EBFC0E|nr:hypothetical protein [Adlercreutzia sp. ZJ141]
MQNDKRQIAAIAPIKGGKRAVAWAALIVCVVALAVGSVAARYVTENPYSSEMESAVFHISSDYLAEPSGEGNSVSHTVPYADTFDIYLYNYEKENVALISQVDIAYTVTAQNATVSVKTADGAPINPGEGGSYQLMKAAGEDGKAQQVLHVTPTKPTSPDNPITVTVKTTSPYVKTLTAKFTVAGSVPSYTIEDQGDGTVLVTVTTNDYTGNVTLKWNNTRFSPDNTNELMSTWTDASAAGATATSAQGIFTAQRNSTYKLLFFKNTAEPYNGGTEKTGTGAEITLE